jgi:hypothetical protein
MNWPGYIQSHHGTGLQGSPEQDISRPQVKVSSFVLTKTHFGLKVLEMMKLDSAQRICFVKMSKSPTEVRCSATTHLIRVTDS